jgi:bacterioferritin
LSETLYFTLDAADLTAIMPQPETLFQANSKSKGKEMANMQIIDKLNEILRHEWTGVAQYAQAGFVVSGLWREVYAGMFHDNATESYGHAKLVGDKIVALGGVPTVERNPVKQSSDLAEMLQFALEFESAAVRLYTDALGFCGDDRALEVFLEDILKEEQEGVDEITKLLRDSGASAAGQASSAAQASG